MRRIAQHSMPPTPEFEPTHAELMDLLEEINEKLDRLLEGKR